MDKEESILEERNKKVKEIFFKKDLWVILAVIVLVIFGVYTRVQPMLDHGGKPGLWDIATNSWTLGPDLDPWLFTRYAKTMIETGSLPQNDALRNVPLGFDTSIELQMVSYMIILTYKITSALGNMDINFAAALMPVILFGLTVISFFFFVREIFSRKDSENKNLKANLIAVISTLFMITIPIFLSRTVAGIPEKESVAFFFMFLSFYLFLKAWKSEKMLYSGIFGVLAGISTGLMGLTWGGVSYIYASIAILGIIAFILNKFSRKNSIVYILWFFVSIAVTQIFSNRSSIMNNFISIDGGLISLVIFVLMIHALINSRKLSELRFFKETKIPKNILSLIIGIILAILIVSIFFGPGVIIEKVKAIHQTTFKPITGRWSTTVAENRQPYFTEWGSSFGPFMAGIPIIFWLFFIGSIVLFRKMLSKLGKKEAWILTCLYILFFLGLVFSRYAPHPNIFDGEGFFSQTFYYGSALLFVGAIICYYIKYHRENKLGFNEIEFEYIFLFSLFILCIFTARSAVRLIMVLGPIAPIFASYLGVESVYGFKNAKSENKKLALGIAALIIIILLLFSLYSYYKGVKAQSYSFIPTYYNQQWQKAMAWVRNNTAENAVFAHWWDYGYWIQSIGNRATVTDGGNAVVWWNYLTGRLVLTGDNQKDSLDFLYSHNASYLLVDSSDIGKYTAFSSIGSDENYDRFSWFPVMLSSGQEQETKEGIMKIYQGGSSIDEDINYELNGTKIYLASQNTGIAGVTAEVVSDSVMQPIAVFYSQGKQIPIPLRYAYYNNKFYDFNSGLEGTVYIMPQVSQSSQGLQIDYSGALMYISPRAMKGFFSQVYLLNDPFNNFPNFRLVHSEENLIIDSLNSQGAKLNEFSYFGDVQGPIKIWKIEYAGNEEVKQEYLDIDPSKYIGWQL